MHWIQAPSTGEILPGQDRPAQGTAVWGEEGPLFCWLSSHLPPGPRDHGVCVNRVNICLGRGWGEADGGKGRGASCRHVALLENVENVAGM